VSSRFNRHQSKRSKESAQLFSERRNQQMQTITSPKTHYTDCKHSTPISPKRVQIEQTNTVHKTGKPNSFDASPFSRSQHRAQYLNSLGNLVAKRCRFVFVCQQAGRANYQSHTKFGCMLWFSFWLVLGCAWCCLPLLTWFQ
jgi:hypothetical protein